MGLTSNSTGTNLLNEDLEKISLSNNSDSSKVEQLKLLSLKLDTEKVKCIKK